VGKFNYYTSQSLMPMSLPADHYHKTPRPHQSPNLVPLNIIRTETVLSKLPIHNLSKKGKIDIQIARKNEKGDVNLLWQVTPHPAFGEPRQLAFKLDSLVINRRIDEIGRPIPEIVYLGSLRDMAKELSLGNNTPEVKKALRQNAHAVIKVKLTYTDKDGAEQVAEFESTRYGVIFTGETLPTGQKADAVYLVLNPPYRQVLNSAPVRPLDYDYLKSLAPSAHRFYELISYRIYTSIKYGHRHAKLLYSEYCTLSAQERYYDYDHVKKQMYKVQRPHRLSGYISSVNFEATTDQEGKPDWFMLYTPGPKAKAEYKIFNRKYFSDDTSTEDVPEEATDTHLVSPSPAEELVALFHRLFHHALKAYPNQKELDQANSLISLHSFDRAKHIVEYSHRVAAETNYKPRAFGGILHYATPALATYDEEQKRKQANASIDACKECDSSGWIHFQEANGHTFTAKCPHDLRMIQSREQRDGLTRIL
jgi:hypothetical protein